jgi:tetratricopeptide (TPR) repeat protein
VELSRRDINLYRSLGDRLKNQTRPADSERAYTSIVEMQPNESESHAMLAEIRQSQDRWPEAIDQWQQVVRVRTLEPTGFLKLAEAQLHEKRWDDALQTIDTLLRKDWPERFGDVHRQAQEMKARIEKGR